MFTWVSLSMEICWVEVPMYRHSSSMVMATLMIGNDSPARVSSHAISRHSGNEDTSFMWPRLMGSVSLRACSSSLTLKTVVIATSSPISSWNSFPRT